MQNKEGMRLVQQVHAKRRRPGNLQNLQRQGQVSLQAGGVRHHQRHVRLPAHSGDCGGCAESRTAALMARAKAIAAKASDMDPEAAAPTG